MSVASGGNCKSICGSWQPWHEAENNRPRKHRKVRKSSVFTRRPASNLRTAETGDWSAADQSDGLLTAPRLKITLPHGLLATELEDANFLCARTRIGLRRNITESYKRDDAHKYCAISKTLNTLLSMPTDAERPSSVGGLCRLHLATEISHQLGDIK